MCQLKCELAAMKNVHVWIVNFPQRYFPLKNDWVVLLYYSCISLTQLLIVMLRHRMTWLCISNPSCQGALETRKWKNWLLWDFCKRGDEGQTKQHTNYIATKNMLTLYWGQKNLSVKRRVYTTKLYKTPCDINTNCMILALTWKNKGKKWTIKFCEDNKHRKLKSGLGSNIRQTSATIGFQHCKVVYIFSIVSG